LCHPEQVAISKALRVELKPMVSLAAPLVIAELGWMAMGIVDTMMVGRLADSAVAIGGVSLGGILYYTCTMYGAAMLLGLDTLVSQAYGAGSLRDCHRSLWTGIFLALCLVPPAVLATLGLAALLPAFGVNPQVAPVASSYARILTLGSAPLLIYFVLRRYLQALSLAKPIMVTLVSANLVNFAANWVLIYGNLGAPAMGTDGSAWATVVSRLYLAGTLVAVLLYYDRKRSLGVFRVEWRPDWPRLVRLVRLGFPAATHMILEIAVFAAATALISRLEPVSLAAHQIALLVASATFMVPLGISSAAAVRVGHAIGRGDAAGAAGAGWTAIGMGAAFMACAAIVFIVFPRQIAAVYTADRAVIESSVSMLLIAAVFQLFDGCQIVSSGALRGAGDTRTPMLCNLVFYWLVGLPAGYLLCFRAGWGAPGLWIGLCIGLVLIGTLLVYVWHTRAAEFPERMYLIARTTELP
jgi:MATE family multidrug resistance protein